MNSNEFKPDVAPLSGIKQQKLPVGFDVKFSDEYHAYVKRILDELAEEGIKVSPPLSVFLLNRMQHRPLEYLVIKDVKEKFGESSNSGKS